MKLRVFYDGIKYRLRRSKNALELVEKVIRSEKKLLGDLCFIITSDKKLIIINREFLRHDYYTDVIAFSECDNNIINGEIYISIDTVKRNANNYKVSLKEEILRVMIHGTLHLCGYTDKSEREVKIMRKKEDNWLLYARKDGIQI